MAVKLGEMLLKAGMITQPQLQEALESQKKSGGKLGFNLVKMGFVKDEEITALLSKQYGVPSINLTQFEIDPAVIFLARDSDYFTFLKDARARLDIVPGDARSTLARSTDRYGLIVVDAFTSDAIPVHLLTREALEIYRARLNEGGILAFNVSNRYLDLESVLGDLAAAARPRMACMALEDLNPSERDRREGQSPSHWVMLAEDAETLDPLRHTAPWGVVKGRPGRRVWSDDYTNLIGALKWQSLDER